MKKSIFIYTVILLCMTTIFSMNLYANAASSEQTKKSLADFPDVASYIRYSFSNINIDASIKDSDISQQPKSVSQGFIYSDIDGKRTIDPTKPMIALTFDDGPGDFTEQLLDCLSRNGAKATFFVAGNRLNSRKSTLIRMRNEGHEIGSHSWSHPSLSTLNYNSIVSELSTTKNKIFDITGINCKIVRPPYGACNSTVRQAGKDLGVHFFNWSVDTLDWQLRNAPKVHNAVVNGAYDGAIILCHDIHKTTVDAMETAIPKLIENGYQLVTVSELMAFSNTTVVPGGLYFQR